MNMMKMMQKAGQMKSKMQEMQNNIGNIELEGEAAGGAVKCTISGKFQVKNLSIDKSLVNPDEIELLEDTILVALNDARQKVEDNIKAQTEKIMSDLGLPAGMDIPF